jgi:1,4-alpha-glucan branching enzyme
VKALNQLYRTEPALYEKSFESGGFEWIDGGNDKDSILIYGRKGHDPKNDLVIVLNMTPTPHRGFRVGVPHEGHWKEIFNSDDKKYWGSGLTNGKAAKSDNTYWHGRQNSIEVDLPPLGAAVFKRVK